MKFMELLVFKKSFFNLFFYYLSLTIVLILGIIKSITFTVFQNVVDPLTISMKPVNLKVAYIVKVFSFVSWDFELSSKSTQFILIELTFPDYDGELYWSINDLNLNFSSYSVEIIKPLLFLRLLNQFCLS